MTHPYPNRRFVPQAVLTKSGKINTVGASVNTAVRPVNTNGSKPTVNYPRPISNAYKKEYSQVTRPFNKYSANKNNIFNKKVNTVRVKDTTARDRAVVSENKGKGVNVVKASACWKEYKEKGVIDSGCSRHMTGNKCYLTEYEDYDGGFVSFEDEENAEFHQIVDFLSTCSINYALTVSPTIYASYIEQFWNTATSKTVNLVNQLHAIFDGKAVVISESSVRSDLLFNDKDGIACLTNDEIFENLALMGYEQLSTKLTFQKGSFSPQWKFLIHTILHCISSKSTAWNEFSTNLASAVICLAKGQNFNFSKLIFDGMLRNLDPKRFLMYLRFLQLFLNNQLKDLPEPFNDTYETPTHSKKVFSNMARKSKKFSGKVTPLFDSMLVQNQAPEGEGSAIPPEPQPTPSTSQPNVSEPQTETPPTVSHELQTEAHIEQILPSPSTYQRKQRKTQKHRRAKQVTALPQTSVPLDHGADEAVHKEGVTVWQSQAPRNHGGALAQTRSERVLEKPNEPPLPEGHTSRSGEGSMEHTFELMDTVPPTPYDSPLTGGYTPGSDEGRLKLKELMAICTKLSKQVLDLEKEKDAQAVEILKLKQRVKKLERKRKSSISHPRRRIYRQVESFNNEEDASKQRRKSDKTKSMFQDSEFDVLDDDMNKK
ncbi:hypothetical protein Tco_0834953 [Tanacetum coccineum]